MRGRPFPVNRRRRGPASVSVECTNALREPAMSETDKVFAGSIPKVYDTYLVPLIFEPYAADEVDRLIRVKKPSSLTLLPDILSLT